MTGSNFDDVIIGPTQDVTEFGLEPFHGRLTVNAGAGKDVVAPGRGGSLIQLGSDADKVVFGRGDLFGEANLLDFKFHEGDRIYIDSDIRHSSSGDTLTLTDSKTGAQKIVRLTGSSDKHWHRHAVHRIKHSTSIPSTTAIDPSALSAYPISSSFVSAAKGEFNYLETHSFDVSNTFKLLGSALIIKPSGPAYDVVNGTVTSNAYKLPKTLQLQIGNQWQTVKSTDSTSIAVVNNQSQSYVTRSYTINLSTVVKNSQGVATWDLATWFQTLGNNSSELAYQISITPFDDPSDNGNRWQPGNRQAQVFITRSQQSGSQASYKITKNGQAHSTPWHGHIQTDLLPALPNEADNFSPHTEWTTFNGSTPGKKRVAYLGGLARVFLKSGIDAKANTPPDPTAPLKPLQITVTGDFEVGIGTGGYNLSSRMMIWDEIDASLAAEVITFQNAYEHQTDLHSSLTNGKLHSMVTDQPVAVNGMGRISGWNIINNYPTSTRDDPVSEQPFYWINSDLLAVSSVHQTDASNRTDWAVRVRGVTVGWPAKRGDASVLLQDFQPGSQPLQLNAPGPARGSIVVSDQNEINFSPSAIDTRFNFQNSKVAVYDFKQVGGWVDQADGPKVAAYHSKISNSFIHANDDSIKIEAPNVFFNDMTVLQGNAGNAVGYAYGFVNGGVTNSLVDSLWVHRVTNNADAPGGNPYGLVTMRIVPSPDYFYDQALKNEGFLTTTVKDVYVPQYSSNDGVTFNSLGYAVGITIADTVRGFGAVVDPQRGDVFDFPIGEISMHEGWDISPKLLGISSSMSADYQKTYGSGSSWINIGSDDYRYIGNANGEGTWTQVSSSSSAKPGSGNESLIVSLPPKSTNNFNWSITLDYNDSSDGYKRKHTGETQKNKATTKLSAADLVMSGVASQSTMFAEIYYRPTKEKTITRPVLHRSTKIIVNRQNGLMGPDPVKFSYSSLADMSLIATSDTATSTTYVVSSVASGYVEKKRSDGSWVDVSTPPTTSNPRALLQLLQNRMITPSDEIRWVPGTANEGKASAEAFSLYGWDGVSASVEASEIEVGVE